MMSLIEQQVWLAQGEYVKVIAHSEGLLRRCEAMHYGLVGLQARIQLAAAQLRFGQRAEARAALAARFAGRCAGRFLGALCGAVSRFWPPCWKGRTGAVRAAPGAFRGPHPARRPGLCRPAHGSADRPAPLPPLTDRDRELARLVAGRCTNKEIAAALYLSEGTVKQYINQLYAKLDMGGKPQGFFLWIFLHQKEACKMKEQTTRTPPKLRVLSAFLAVAMLLTLLPAAAFAAPAPESDFEYGASNGRAIIRKYKGAGGTVEIPATLGGYPVTGIKMQAFIECTSLKSVSMPESMTWIGDSAFAGCTGLEQVEFSPNLTTIGPNSFYSCNGLTSVVVPDKVTSIDLWLFLDA